MNVEKCRKDIKLLNESIDHWHDIIINGTEPTATNCPLCIEYSAAMDQARIHCEGCPIEAKTDEDSCGYTPFNEAFDEYIENQDLGFGMIDKQMNEIRFLTDIRTDLMKTLKTHLHTANLLNRNQHKNNLLKKKREAAPYKIGDKFKYESLYYMIAKITDTLPRKIQLTNLVTGNVRSGSVEVKDYQAITPTQFEEAAGGPDVVKKMTQLDNNGIFKKVLDDTYKWCDKK